ncbi:MAG: hypothetical protein L0Y71_14505 [Gemmataceae bacterium]|nr:hypothetical protein [Gemmataceae bacterium]
MPRADIVPIIYAVIERLNELREPDNPVPCTVDTPLYGPKGHLDSLGLVSFLLDVEEGVNALAGTQLVLADERAMSQHRNPFRDVGALADYISFRLQEVMA